MRFQALLAILLLALVGSGCSGKSKTREPADLADIENPEIRPRTEWSATVGSGSGKLYNNLTLELTSDALFAADYKGRVFAFDPLSGERLWRADTGANLIAGPAVAGNAVFVGSRDAAVIALSRTDGSELWRAKVSTEVHGSPVSDGEVVVVRTLDGRTFGLSASSGIRLWAFDRSMPALVLRGMSAPLIASGRVLVGMDTGRLAALQVSDGTVLWEQTVAVPEGRTELERLTDIDGDLIDGSRCVYAASFGGEVACLELGSGQALWRRDVRSYLSLGFGEEKLYVTDDTSVVWALDAQSGAAAWRQESMLYRKLSGPAFFRGFVVAGDDDGYLHWMSPSDGRLVGRNRIGSDPILVQPVAGEELLYVLNQDGRLRAIRAAE